MRRVQTGNPSSTGRQILGIEAGGTRTVALLAGAANVALQRGEFGPANLRLVDDRELVRHLRQIAATFPRPSAIAIGMAGARTEADRARLREAAATAWKDVPCIATSDLETGWLAAGPFAPPVAAGVQPSSRSRRRGTGSEAMARVLILSGTGSCCYGQDLKGRTAKIGGWGHMLGDKGSGYELGLRGLKAAVYYFDRDGRWPKLGQNLLGALQLNEPNELIPWVQQATKSEIAALAPVVFQAWARHDSIATDILHGAANSLAKDAVSCAQRLAKHGAPVEFVLAGGVLTGQPRFASKVRREIQQRWPNALVTTLRREGTWGAVELARRLPETAAAPARATRGSSRQGGRVAASPVFAPEPASLALSPTEQRNPRSMNLDRLPLRAAIELMAREDQRIPGAILREAGQIERAIRLITRSLKRNGRLIYIGAGTSGRLGVLDASECPPTFQSDPERVQGVIAGGQRALWQSVEGAEDDAGAGTRAIEGRGVSARDTVVGIAASGRTPFVWGALRAARAQGAGTVLLCFNPHLAIPRAQRPDVIIAPRIGPEILTGSTRLKAGTATKLILNMFTTLAMVRLGKVCGNLMVDVKASNAKLRDRAVRIVRELTGADAQRARRALEKAAWRIKPACRALRRQRPGR